MPLDFFTARKMEVVKGDQPRDAAGRFSSTGHTAAMEALKEKGFSESMRTANAVYMDRQTPRGTETVHIRPDGSWRHTDVYGNTKTSGKEMGSLKDHASGLVKR